MSKFLPLEYCRLDRAARMLECEIDDLIHWGAIGAIDLCLQISSIKCDIVDQRDSVSPDSEFSSSDTFYVNNGLACFWRDKKYKYSIQDRRTLKIKDAINYAVTVSPSDVDEFEYDQARCGGFWPLPRGVFLSLEASDDGRYQLYGSMTLCCRESDGLVFAGVFFDNEDLYLTSSDLWITRKDIETLRDALNTDNPVLPNIFNNDEISAKVREQECNVQAEVAPRTTTKQSDVIKALILLNPDLKELINKPSKLTDRIDQLCTGKIKVTLPTEKSMAKWLDNSNVEEI